MASTLDEIEKICFTCTLPPEDCGKPGIICDYMKATQERPSHRRKTPQIQHSCGFPEKNLEDS